MVSYQPLTYPVHNWTVRKPIAESSKGVVASQVYDASAAGVAVLEAGGNAVDAAVATAFALAVVEPWNSGLGGVGFALYQGHDKGTATSIHFGPVAPRKLRPELFPLTGRPATDLFPWPQVENDANSHGPLSFCLPTAVAGYGTMLERWGTMPLSEVLQPAIVLAKRGLPSDWFSTLMLAQAAPIMRKYGETARIFLRDGLPPVPPYQGTPGFLPLGRMSETLERLAHAGWRDFYQGDLATSIVRDIAEMGGLIGREELDAYEVETAHALSVPWGDSSIQLSSGMNAGPTLADAFKMLEPPVSRREEKHPSAQWYVEIAKALKAAYKKRLHEDSSDPSAPKGCTTHLNVCDAKGSMVALTTTLLSSMGSRVVLPSTGFVMNNGVMWFDPRPGTSNSVEGGKKALSNMCPAIISRDGRPVVAGGAAGGRRIMAAVAQLLLLVHDFDMSVGDAAHCPRIDVSGPEQVSADRRLPALVLHALRELGECEVVDHNVLPINFARPSVIERFDGRTARGVSDAFSPWSAALGPQ
ncbi:gamma-glutamyltransferase [Caballeronia arvi]|uniref:Gamma-glutamyltransferase n=1 Tax=Caballeronia arvi TaxID=1777135 RepID=A0A158KX30_9BURK|nr:gamma-glutamyltransferase [Caballeronia arvi]SAL85289.1 gamma-glutamyltransferase [Caballeronia arvi]